MRTVSLGFVGFPKHTIREDGLVVGPKGPLKPRPDDKGYPRVRLHYSGFKNDITVHRLVARAFLPNPLNKPEVNHKDGNKWNAHVQNLEWVTKAENNNHAIINGLRPGRRDRRRGDR